MVLPAFCPKCHGSTCVVSFDTCRCSKRENVQLPVRVGLRLHLHWVTWGTCSSPGCWAQPLGLRTLQVRVGQQHTSTGSRDHTSEPLSSLLEGTFEFPKCHPRAAVFISSDGQRTGTRSGLWLCRNIRVSVPRCVLGGLKDKSGPSPGPSVDSRGTGLLVLSLRLSGFLWGAVLQVSVLGLSLSAAGLLLIRQGLYVQFPAQ